VDSAGVRRVEEQRAGLEAAGPRGERSCPPVVAQRVPFVAVVLAFAAHRASSGPGWEGSSEPWQIRGAAPFRLGAQQRSRVCARNAIFGEVGHEDERRRGGVVADLGVQSAGRGAPALPVGADGIERSQRVGAAVFLGWA
jgi:hypothetical protein